MTDTFRERERGEEAKFKLDGERHFKVLCRRNKLFGLWAANRLGLSATDAEDYAKNLVMMLLDEHDPDSALKRVRDEFNGQGLATADVNDAFARFYTEAELALRGEWHALGADHMPIGG
ncbi:MAG: DUF1476 domain-containing protein [Rhodospirillales bacterium]|jgi:hypothetical protein|nr:DUF1476 domain-containing protein [Rhodospirillales bacterium]